MKISLTRIWIRADSYGAQQKGSVGGEVVFDKGLKLEFDEELLPEELEYIQDGLADLMSRVKVRVTSAIRAAGEEKAG